MKVSIQLNTPANRQAMTLREVDFDTALAITAALRTLPQADVEAVIVVENLVATQRPSRNSHQPQRARTGAGWLRGLRWPMPVAWVR